MAHEKRRNKILSPWRKIKNNSFLSRLSADSPHTNSLTAIQGTSQNSAPATQAFPVWHGISNSRRGSQEVVEGTPSGSQSRPSSVVVPTPFRADLIDQPTVSNPEYLAANNTPITSIGPTQDGDRLLSPTRTRTNVKTVGMHQGRDRSPSIVRSFTFEEDPTEDQSLAPAEASKDNKGAEGTGAIIVPLDVDPLPRRKSTRSLSYHNDQDELQVIFPPEIKCALSVTFNEEQKFDRALPIEPFVWYEKKSYDSLENIMKKIRDIFEERRITKDTEEIYLRYASCFVKGNRNQSSHKPDDDMLIVDENMVADAAIQAICGFIRDYPFQRFELRIHCDYSSIDKALRNKDGHVSWPQDQLGFTQAIRDVYVDKLAVGRPTIKAQRYISLADHLTGQEIVRRIVVEDANSAFKDKLTLKQKDALTHEIMTRPASTLQAVCVYDCIPMSFLYHLLCEEPHVNHRRSDNFETLRFNEPNECNSELCHRYYTRFIDNTYVFYPETVKPDAEHSIKADKMIVPVRNVDGNTVLGEGGFSTVYEVDIDPHYQLLSPNVTKTYALKIFNTAPRYRDGFKREIAMLLRLARYLPHEHILTHITSWEQGGTYYILYEKAHRNLRKHMEKYRGGDFSRKRILWLFYQLRGLADAIRRVHFFHESDIDPDSGVVHAKKTGMVGRHHDIKPENILAFDFSEDLPTLKLSDFGSGKFSAVRAYSESGQGASTVRGTQTYVGPEHIMNREMKRPFDMWALGCVFLELLLWFLGTDKPDGEQTFADMRTDARINPRPEEYDYFWQRDGLGYLELNSAVVWVLDDLQNRVCKDKPLFQDLIAIIRKLLVIEPKDRLTAVELFHRLDFVFVKAQADIEQGHTGIESIRLANHSTAVERLDDDVSTTGKSRVRSATNLRLYDATVSASDPPLTGETSGSLGGAGQQFEGHLPQTIPEPLHGNDEDELVMGGPSEPRLRPGLMDEMDQNARSLENKPYDFDR